MTQIRRQTSAALCQKDAGQQRRTLLRVAFVLLGISGAAVLLFRLDSFPSRNNGGNRHVRFQEVSSRTATALTPDKLLQNQRQRETLRRYPGSETGGGGGGGEEEEEEESAGGTEKGDVEATTKEETANQIKAASDTTTTTTSNNNEAVETRRYVMELSRLKQDTQNLEENTGRVYFETHRSWAPLGADHFHKLVQSEFYDECRFFRVVPHFMVQFGIAASPAAQQRWKSDILRDDPVTQSNSRGTITFATSGPNSRTTQLFINTVDNSFLDRQGFSPFGKVMEGMENVDRVQDKYREKPSQPKIVRQGNAYLDAEFPDLSYMVSIRELS